MRKKPRAAPYVQVTMPTGEDEEAEQETDDEAAWADDEYDTLGRYLHDIGSYPIGVNLRTGSQDHGRGSGQPGSQLGRQAATNGAILLLTQAWTATD